MSWCKWIPTTTVLGLAAQSARWERSMQENLWNMAREASKAVELADAASAKTAEAEELAAQALETKSEGDLLVARGQELTAKSEADFVTATAEQADAEALLAKAAGEEAAAATEFAEAAAEEVLVEEETAEATAEAARAVRNGFQAKEEEVVVGACEVVPVLNVVCDVVGGLAAVGLESSALAEAARAASEYAEAVALQVEEESQLAEATDLQGEATVDEQAGAGEEAAAAEIEAQAQEELAEGERDETAGQEKLDQSVVEEEASEKEEAEAALEEEMSVQSGRKALGYGAAACWDGILAGLVSLVALGFFSVRIVFSFLVPATTSLCTHVIPNIQMLAFPAKAFSHVFHHVFIFALVGGCFGEMLLSLENLSIRSRGGILLQFAFCSALTQSLLLHCLPKTVKEGFREGLILLLRCFLVLTPLFLIEMLLLRVNLERAILSPAIVGVLQHWFLWVLLGLTLTAHMLIVEKLKFCNEANGFEKPQIESRSERAGLIENDVSSGEKCDYGTQSCSTGDGAMFDVDLELRSSHRSLASSSNNVELRSFGESLWKDLTRLEFPFELLIATAMLAVLRHSIPNLKRIWPTSKAVLAETHPHWQLVFLGSAILSIATLILCLRFSLRQPSPRAHDP